MTRGPGVRRATVQGLGLFGGGAAAVRWLAAHGTRVTVTDLRDAEVLAPALASLAGVPCEVVLGEHRERDFTDTDLVVANPAVPPDNPYLAAARTAGVPVTSELGLFLEHGRARVVLVTGTQGKSSTTTFLERLLRPLARRVHAGGNLGRPLLEGTDTLAPDELCVVEVSSYQLEALEVVPRPTVEAALITNVGVDHLERHGDAAGYARAKARIVGLVRPGGTLVLPAELTAAPPFDDLRGDLRVVLAGPGAALRREGGRFRHGDADLGAEADLTVPGGFQRENALLALGLAHALGAPAEALRAALPELGAPPHRAEPLDGVPGRRVIDNGVSTTPESTRALLDDLPGPVTLLVGGQAKRDLDHAALARACVARGDRVHAFGASGPWLAELWDAAGGRARVHGDLEGATRAALADTPEGGTLLFSPACASFDAYPNFRARALAFRDHVRGPEGAGGDATPHPPA